MGAFTLYAGCGLLALTGQQPIVAIASLGIGLAFSGGPALITGHIVAHTDSSTYGPAFAAATLSFGIAQMISPQIGGLIADATGSFTLVFVLSATISMVCGSSKSPSPTRHVARVHCGALVVKWCQMLRSAAAQYWARITFLSGFPTAVRGRASTNSMVFGV